ncbi:hypothetical protein [Streptomyces justiciae]|uniref:Uncharacterized protein n=1 Tax=Streptomyces justiciae TaxID=2780140 RepID=A0ABU3LIY1_9ACTN|nr:hypothetical protein [Streptomyces justiciae]MDT7839125.1 hypothetical protein [Streptomyces justiciae]
MDRQTYGTAVPAKDAKGLTMKIHRHEELGGELGDHLRPTVDAASGNALVLRVTDQRVGLVGQRDGTGGRCRGPGWSGSSRVPAFSCRPGSDCTTPTAHGSPS